VPRTIRVLSGVSAALTIALSVAPLLGQEHQHPTAVPGRQAPPITPTAKKLNEGYKSNCEPFAAGFESPGRELFDRRVDVVNSIGLKPGMTVADIGAGSGLFSRLMAERVGPTGAVYAVEISPCLINYINKSARAANLQNIKTVLGTVRTPKLAPNSVDVIFIAESYHHFEYPKEMLQQIRKALRPDGVFMLVDLERIEDISPTYVLDMVRAGKGTFTDEIRNAGFELIEDIQILELDYVLKFKHREALQERPPESPR
jgi:cyclopropane fatty-acyl-phospholipid synthase-like methyltransferase